MREIVTTIERTVYTLGYYQDFSKIFEKLVRGMLILEQRWKEHFPVLLPQCWQQQSREVNMSQLLQSVFPPQSIWITINKTWNAFKNSIAKSLVSTWSLFILKKRADLEEMAFSSMNSLYRRLLRQFYFKHNTAYENETWSDLNRRIKVFSKPTSVGLIPLISTNFRLDLWNWCFMVSTCKKHRKKYVDLLFSYTDVFL